MENFRVFIEKDPYSNTVKIKIVMFQGNKILAVKPMKMEFEQIKEGENDDKPALELDRYFADGILEALKKALEGKSLSGVEGELKATKYHLEDMRKIAFEGGKK